MSISCPICRSLRSLPQLGAPKREGGAPVPHQTGAGPGPSGGRGSGPARSPWGLFWAWTPTAEVTRCSTLSRCSGGGGACAQRGPFSGEDGLRNAAGALRWRAGGRAPLSGYSLARAGPGRGAARSVGGGRASPLAPISPGGQGRLALTPDPPGAGGSDVDEGAAQGCGVSRSQGRQLPESELSFLLPGGVSAALWPRPCPPALRPPPRG